MPFLQKAGRALKEFDLFGTPISLNLDKKSLYKSCIGAIVSILSLLLITTLCWNIFISYLKQENLYISTENDFNPNPDLLELNQDNFFFAVNIQQVDSLKFANIPYFGIVVEQAYYERTGQNKIKRFTRIPMQKCKEENIENLGELVNQTIERIGIQNMICPSASFSILLEGQYTSEIFQFLKIRVIDCDESNKEWGFDRCATQNEKDQFLAAQQQFRVTIFHTNYSFNLNHKGTFFYKYLNEELTFTFVPGKVFKTNDIFYKPVSVKSDENSLVTQTFDTSNFILQEFRDIKEYFTINDASKDYQISYLRRSPDSIHMRREYQKFSAVMIQFGGLIKFIITIAGFFVTKYNSFLFTVELANKLYNFNFGNQKINKPQVENSESKQGCSSYIKSNEPSPLKIKNKSIQMITLKQDQNQDNPTTKSTQSNQNGNTILNSLCKKRNSTKKTSPKITPRSLVNIEEDHSPQYKESNISKIQKKESLERIDEELSKQIIEIKISEEQQNKPTKQDLPIQHIAQKFQNHRKDSVRQLQMFQENIQNQYYNNIKKKKASIFNSAQQQNELKKNFSNNDLLKGETNGINHKNSILNNPIVIPQSNNLIQNLVYFKEIGFKNKKDFLVEQFRCIINRSKKITVKVWYFLRLLTCGKCFNTEENFLIEKAREYAQKDLDIYIILDKLQEIEKIKKILLDENQLTLFNFSQKPLIQKNDHFFNTVSLRNLQIKHRKSETFASKAKASNSSHNLLGLEKTLFCQKLQYNNIEAYEKLHKAYENITPFHIQDKLSRQLIKEIGPELREIFELSKIIDGQNENTPKSTPLRNASKTQYSQHNSKHLDDLDLNQYLKQEQNKSRNSIHICDGVYSSVNKLPSRTLYVNECLSPEEKPVDEIINQNSIKNPYTFTSSSTNKPARLSLFKNLKGVLIHDQNQPIQEDQSSGSSSSSSSSCRSSSQSSSQKSKNKSYNSHQIKQQISLKNNNPQGVNLQEEFLESHISQSQNNNQEEQQDQVEDYIKDDPYNNTTHQNSPTFQPSQQQKQDFNLSQSFKMNLVQISLNQTLFVQEIDLDLMNDSNCKAITETCLKEQDIQLKEKQDSPKNPIN